MGAVNVKKGRCAGTGFADLKNFFKKKGGTRKPELLQFSLGEKGKSANAKK